MNDLGVHVFEQTNSIQYETELVAFNLLSILSWKRFHGPIHLYCNTTYLNTLKKWGVDTLYDSINTHIIDNKPDNIDYQEFWAYTKFLVLDHLKDSDKPFTLVDTDLWIQDKLDLNKNVDVVMYHKENFDVNYWNNIYLDFDFFISENVKSMDFNKSILPTNGALLHVKNTKFIKEWLNISEEIAVFNSINKIEIDNKSTRMCFIEQRLLPMLLEKRGFTYDTFISQVYQSQLVEKQDGSEWLPRIHDSRSEEMINFQKIKHVWGMKRFFNHRDIYNLVMESTLTCLSEYEISDKPYKNLYFKLLNELLTPQP
jgi:hypothetical protein